MKIAADVLHICDAHPMGTWGLCVGHKPRNHFAQMARVCHPIRKPAVAYGGASDWECMTKGNSGDD